MLRMLAIAAMFAVAVPTLAAAQEHHDEHHPGGKPPPPGPHGAPPPGPHGPPPHGPMTGPHPGPVGPHAGGPAGEHFTYHGHPFNRFHAAPFVYPHGWEYRRWAVGAALPPLFLTPAYYYSGWAELGLEPPQPGFHWVRYGPDLLLVNVSTGEVVETIYDAFY